MLNGFVGSMAAFGTDHDLMQRLLTVETRRESQRTLAITPLGTLRHARHLPRARRRRSSRSTPSTRHLPVSRPDEIVPHFVGQMMPPLLRGLMLSAIVLASIDSPLGSLAASFVTDIYRPLLVARPAPSATTCCVSRISVVVFGIVLAVLAYAFSFFSQILWLAFKIAGVTFGSLLGVFLLGLLTAAPRGRPRQRRRDDRDGAREPRAAHALGDEGARLRVVVAGDLGTLGHDGARARHASRCSRAGRASGRPLRQWSSVR